MASQYTLERREREKKDTSGNFNTSSSSGASMLSGFTELGDKLQNNAMKSMQMGRDWEQQNKDNLRQEGMDEEEKRRFEIENRRANQSQALNSQDFLSRQRQQAGQTGRMAVQAFHTGLLGARV
jgi:hypothetical protein